MKEVDRVAADGKGQNRSRRRFDLFVDQRNQTNISADAKLDNRRRALWLDDFDSRAPAGLEQARSWMESWVNPAGIAGILQEGRTAL